MAGRVTETSVMQFDKWFRQAKLDFNPHFIPVRNGEKTPNVLMGESWKDKRYRMTAPEARLWLKRGGNVGFVARKDLAVIDLNHEGEARKLLDPALFDTLRVTTRSGGVHLYFVNCGVENADVSGVAELRADWRYVLAPGSYVLSSEPTCCSVRFFISSPIQ